MAGDNDPARVQETAAPFGHVAPSDDWVHEAIAMTRPGIEIEFPARQLDDRPIPFAYDDFS